MLREPSVTVPPDIQQPHTTFSYTTFYRTQAENTNKFPLLLKCHSHHTERYECHCCQPGRALLCKNPLCQLLLSQNQVSQLCSLKAKWFQYNSMKNWTPAEVLTQHHRSMPWHSRTGSFCMETKPTSYKIDVLKDRNKASSTWLWSPKH